MRECVDCKEEKRCKARADNPKKPQARCPECSKAYGAAWRKRNWQRVKARDTWKGMISRCYDPKHGVGFASGVPRYAEYGARGVRVSKRWRGEGGFAKFLADVGPPPTREATLDRKNPKRNYTRSNVRWVDKKTQQENKRCTHWVEAPDPETGEAVTLSLAEWGRRTGIHRDTIRYRLKRGWPTQDAVTLAPLEPGQRYQRFEEAPF